ncbi:MAG: CHAT domain-containing protein, partial [Acidobacteria bacterium]|nr:CHAT domain-containing protein [Acidobacteriota bacterium]
MKPIAPDSVGRVWVYVIRSTGAVHWAPLQDRVGDDAIIELSRDYRRALTHPDPLGDTGDELAHEVYLRRIKPVEPALNGVNTLTVIPSGGMLGIPVESLIDDNHHYIGDRFAVRYSPSASILSWLKERQRSSTSPGRI